jgi:hypothetical protein
MPRQPISKERLAEIWTNRHRYGGMAECQTKGFTEEEESKEIKRMFQDVWAAGYQNVHTKCRDSGFPNTMVYLAGKDDHGRTIQLEEDGTKHIHKQVKGQQQQPQPQPQQQQQQTMDGLMKLLVSIDSKLDRLLNLAELRK